MCPELDVARSMFNIDKRNAVCPGKSDVNYLFVALVLAFAFAFGLYLFRLGLGLLLISSAGTSIVRMTQHFFMVNLKRRGDTS